MVESTLTVNREAHKPAKTCELIVAFFLFLFVLAQPLSIAGAEIAYSAAVVAWVIRLVLVRRRALHSSPLDLPILLYLLFCAASAMLSPLPVSSWEGMRKVSLIFLVLLVAHNVPTAARAKQLLALLFLSGLVTVGWTGWEYAAGVGLRIDHATAGTGFSRAGIQAGDVVMRVDGRLIRRPARFLAYLNSKPPGEPLQLLVVHGVVGPDAIALLKAAVPVTVPPGAWPHAASMNELGMQMETARPARALGFYGHYENYAFVLLLLASLALGLWLGRRDLFSIPGLLSAALFLAFVIALEMTETRAAWLALALSCAVQAWFRFGRRSARLLLPVALVLAVLGTSVAMHRLRGTGLIDLSNPGDDYRVLMWRDGLRIVRQHPWFGVGMNTVRDAWQQFDLAAYKKYALRSNFHSTPIQIAVESGLPALLSWVLLMGCYGVMLIRMVTRARKRGDFFHYGLALGILGGTTGFLAGSLVQYDYGDSVVVLLFWFLMGLALAAHDEMESEDSTSSSN